MKKVQLLFLFLGLCLLPGVTQKQSSNRSLMSSWNMIPSQSLAGLYYLFKGYSVNDEGGLVKVSGPVVEITNGEKLGAKMYRDGYQTEKDPEDFEEEQNLAMSIFEASTRLGTGVGTAFLVGTDVVLTNRHVLNYSGEDRQWECGRFSIKLNLKDERVSCRKVRFCSSRYDFCVVEMKKMQNGSSLGEEMRPLRLSRNIQNDRDAFVLHIGNAAGLGIQASQGRGIQLKGGEVFHYAPTLGGSSGAPIFNEKKEVIGINWGYTGNDQIDDLAYNRAALSETIFNELRRTHPYTLKDIKSFRSWQSQSIGLRKVKIQTPAPGQEPERFPSTVRK